ncbi:MAG: DUF1553 domain-containing protein [Bryobacteraceae bacterium]
MILAGWAWYFTRMLVTSSVYINRPRNSGCLWTRHTTGCSRVSPFSVEAEVVRDIALQASGMLNPAVGGPSVYPPAPEFLFKKPVSYSTKDWFYSQGTDKYRRALYTFRYRSVPYPALQTFDAPSGETSCVRRPRSNTPLQALTMLNEPVFLETARSLAKLALRDGGTTEAEKIAYASGVADGPRLESAELLRLLKKEQGLFAQPGRNPALFAAADVEGAAAVDAAAWTAVSRVLLNLDETITKE